MPPTALPRRAFLRGLGTAIALPTLPSLGESAASVPADPSSRPLRLGFVYLPNGMIMENFSPKDFGTDYALPPTLESLAPVKDQLQVVSGLAHEKAMANGDGAGDHARANATFLTGAQARKTAGRDIHLGISVDQVAARHVGRHTPLPSLELSCDARRTAGSCDSGYSCAYQYNLAWRDATTPVPPESNPRAVFERLFTNSFLGDLSTHRERRLRYHRSVLDFVLDDAHRMERRLDAHDRRKLDEYLTSVREVERRIEHAEDFRERGPDGQGLPDGIPKDYAEHLRLQFDLMLLAYQTDMTRVATFLTAFDGSNRSFADLGISGGHHSLSHHRNEADKIEQLKQIDKFYMAEVARFLERMASTADGEQGSLLDHSMIVVGGGISDGNRHSHTNLPVILAGRGGGLQAGRHVDCGTDIPMTNLYLSLLDRMGVQQDRFGDSTGLLSGV